MRTTQSLFSRLPDELILSIFSFVPASSLPQLAGVCRHWKGVAFSEELWGRLVYRDVPQLQAKMWLPATTFLPISEYSSREASPPQAYGLCDTGFISTYRVYHTSCKQVRKEAIRAPLVRFCQTFLLVFLVTVPLMLATLLTTLAVDGYLGYMMATIPALFWVASVSSWASWKLLSSSGQPRGAGVRVLVVFFLDSYPLACWILPALSADGFIPDWAGRIPHMVFCAPFLLIPFGCALYWAIFHNLPWPIRAPFILTCTSLGVFGSAWIALTHLKGAGLVEWPWSLCLAPLWMAVLLLECLVYLHLAPLRRWVAVPIGMTTLLAVLYGLKKDGVLPGLATLWVGVPLQILLLYLLCAGCCACIFEPGRSFLQMWRDRLPTLSELSVATVRQAMSTENTPAGTTFRWAAERDPLLEAQAP
ncbi:hypothetical protein PAPYR_1322 [Paratrimastix pyriformis]|uniref:F-box domain-containing protein n=1 Tax=Paratrimastix pyriformis TaxID=342808 RepID=A0ABQ8UUC4_9EUKA|nr:hypothetical protein PAPYR_1322 [Paratrimastix pyriformis]